ncbi:hypothetical protein SCLCIDRAFT_21054 [Scleroderma citrinum Foug A]|uniref:CxC1-like cysteine cluster associated with KDZ transposases domain-containing protein n=1 Tax=Scleroderma citrinum Foug A TaxID=1036808 RepID=A0A0C3A1J1_9AGAM|nr:hypothetical protein SCLCIDRAFT_21054 [Scleroderma citrinum Foug A]
MAISIDLLAFYRSLFERSCDAINALTSALHNHYVWRGFHIINKHNEAVQEPFQRGLGISVQWFDVLYVEVEQRIEDSLQFTPVPCTPKSSSFPTTPSKYALSTPTSTSNLIASPCKPPLSSGSCASILVRHCPTCFAGTSFGKPLSDGGDIHIAMDGNFHHRHCQSAGTSPPFYDPVYFLSKHQVDVIGTHIEKQQKTPPKARKGLVPDEAIDSCKSSYEAADGKKKKASMDNFDDMGLMALICRHDIPLFFANIDSPGEQQKYAVALLAHLFMLLPLQATVVGLYDVGCVLDRSISLYNILPEQVAWACQLVYNPCLVPSLGLSDGEGTEWLWSRLVKLIGIECSSSQQCRIWLIDRQAAAIGAEMCTDLGDWIKQRLRRGVQEQGKLAQDQMEECGIEVEELERQWASQKESQLSIQSHAPARLKKELDTVLALQADVDMIEKTIQTAKSTMKKESLSDNTLAALGSLEHTHDHLITKVDALYGSLNVQAKFPELDGISLNFVQTLLLARDLKINICKRAIGSFFEWDKLDRAIGGAQKALGTKLHQQTRKAIAKWQPALMSAIHKFNAYCEQLEALHDPAWSIPLPMPLPTKLDNL